MINRNLHIKNILGVVNKIADSDYQERAWVKGEIHWPCSFEELNSQLFDDCFISDFIENDAIKYNLSDQQIRSIKTFVAVLDEFGYKPEIYFERLPLKVDEAKVLAHPEWPQIRKLAENVLCAFGKIEFDLNDKEWWLPFILNSIESFANVREQKCKWAQKNQGFYSTPKDMYLHLFKDNDFDRFMDEYAIKFGCSEPQIRALNQFRTTLKSTFFHSNPSNLSKLLKSPDWKRIQVLAYNVLESFNEQKRVSFLTFWSRKLRILYRRLTYVFRNWKHQLKVKYFMK